MINKIKKLLKKTYKKTIYYNEYESPIRYGYKPEHRVKSYIQIQRIFDFNEGLRYSVTVPNCAWCRKKLKDALFMVLEHESIGMAKYARIKEDLQKQGLLNKIDI